MSDDLPDDLWGHLPSPDPRTRPRAILREQATLLAKRTHGILQGDVRVRRGRRRATRDDILIGFAIVCPTLQNYRYGVLEVRHNAVQIYPAEVVQVAGEKRAFKPADEKEFKQAVAKIFQSPPVQNAIAALMRDAEEEQDWKPDEAPDSD